MNDWFAHKILGLPELASVQRPGRGRSHGLSPLADARAVRRLDHLFRLRPLAVQRRAPSQGRLRRLQEPRCPSTSKLPWWSIEAVLLIGVAIPIWAKNVDHFPKPEESTVVQIMAQQFAWNARYPGVDGKFGRQDMKLISQRQRLWRGPRRPRRQGRRAGAQ